MVTVVDAANFLRELAGGDELAARGLAAHEDDERTISDLLVDQVEFADVIVLNKLDLVGPEDARRLRAALTRLNPAARVVPAVRGRVALAHVLGTGLFDVEKAQQAPGWVRELNGDHVPETEEYGISSVVFRSATAFHPGRLWAFVTRDLDSGAFGNVLRSKGFFRLASRPRVTGLWSQAGAVARFEPSGTDGPGTARGQELVFIGTGLDGEALLSALDACLLAPGESVPAVDEFPAWETYGADDACDAHDHGHGPCRGGGLRTPGRTVVAATAPSGPGIPLPPPCFDDPIALGSVHGGLVANGLGVGAVTHPGAALAAGTPALTVRGRP